MRTIITADLHLNDNPRDAYRHKFLPWLKQQLRKHEADRALLLGDLTEEKDAHSAWLTNTIVEQLSDLAEECPLDILPGNHDYVDVDAPFFQFLHRIKNINWISRPTGMPDRGWMFLPHTRNYKREWEGVVDTFGRYRWIFAHNTFTGADTGFGHKLEGIPLDIFPKGVRVVSGDVHFPQTLGPLTYVGAPCLNDFGEDYEPRVLLLAGNKLTDIPYPGPQKRLIRIKSLKDLKRAEFGKDDVLKIQVELGVKEYQDWPNIKAQVREWATTQDCDVHTVQPLVEAQQRMYKKPRVVSVKSDLELLETYGTQRKIDTRTLKTGLWLLEKV